MLHVLMVYVDDNYAASGEFFTGRNEELTIRKRNSTESKPSPGFIDILGYFFKTQCNFKAHFVQ